MDEIKETICNLSSEAHLSDLEKALKSVFPSNSSERRTLIDILGFCGILETDDHLGFLKKYTRLDCREIPPVSKTDWEYPVMWWRGKFKINNNNYREIFNR